MPYYEFECAKGHVTEEVKPMGTKVIVCPVCFEGLKTKPLPINHDGDPIIGGVSPLAHRILSPTRTTFVFADTGKRIKHVKKVATRGL